MKTASISEILYIQFKKRKAANLRYSMRAFARDLKISPAQLSLLMAGKRGVSPAKAKEMGESLCLSRTEKERFIRQVEATYSRSATTRKDAKQALEKLDEQNKISELSQDSFLVISDWYHFAILQAMLLKGYRSSCKKFGEVEFLSKTLKVSKNDVTEALERLKRIQAIQVENGIHQPLRDHVSSTPKAVPNAALRKNHRQMIQKALTAMEAQDVSERYFRTFMMNIEANDYVKIIEEIHDFYLTLISKYDRNRQTSRKGDLIYAIALQMFRVSHSFNEST